MRKSSILITILIVIILSGCKTYNDYIKEDGVLDSMYIQTGPDFQPLDEKESVKLFLTGVPNVEYIEIGVLRVKNYDFLAEADAYETFKSFARSQGGNLIISEPEQYGSSNDNDFGPVIKQFIIGRMETEN
jgi:hypothetical protein